MRRGIRIRHRTMALLLGLLGILWGSAAFGAMGSVQSLTFDGTGTDRVSPTETLQGDGNRDLYFSLVLEGSGALSGAELKHLPTGAVWDTFAGNGRPLLLVLDRDGTVLNQGSGKLPLVPFLLGTRLRLVASDLAGAAARGGEYEAKVYFVDQSEAVGRVTVSPVGGISPAAPTPGTPSEAPRIVEARLEGPGDRDVVGPGEDYKGNGTPDWRLRLKLAGRGLVTEIRLTNHRGDPGAWDTVPGNGRPLLAVLRPSSEVLNRADGNLRIPFRGETELLIYLENNGTLGRPETRSQITLTLQDGTQIARDVTPAPAAEAAPEVVEFKGPETSEFDFTGPGEKRGGDFEKDRQFSLTLRGKGVLTGVRLRSLKGGASWDTLPDNKTPLVGVGRAGSTGLLNQEAGSLRLSLNGTTALVLYVGGEGALKPGPFRVSLAFEDGKVLERETAGTPGTTGEPPAPGAKLLVLGRPANLKADRVGPNEGAKGNGKPDWGFSVRLEGLEGDQTLTALSVRSLNNAGAWDTVPGNKRWRLLVRRPGGAFLNEPDGSLFLPLSEPVTLQLWMEDFNRALNRTKGSVRVEALLEDGTRLTRDYRW